MPVADLHPELLALLDALCEERLTVEQSARLERIVLADAAARRLYLDYLHLHGTLLWDAARDDLSGQDIPAADFAAVSAVSVAVRGTRRRRVAWTAATAAACLVAFAGFGFLFRLADRQIAHHETPQPVVTTGTETVPRDRPPLRPIELHGRPAATLAAVDPPVEAVRPAETAPADPVAVVDAAILRGWTAAGVAPSADAGDAEWLRRASLDLVGHVPAADEVEAFLADAASDKRSRAVDRLIDRPGFGRNFGTIWTNLLVGRTPPKDVDRAALTAALGRAFAENRPWSETAAALLTASGKADENPAANFLLAHAGGDGASAAAATADVLLGEQLGCVKCHDHPANDRTQRDFWELAGFFRGTAVTHEEDRPVLVVRPQDGPATFENINGLVQATDPAFAGRKVEARPDRDPRAELARLVSEGDRPPLAAAFVNRMWSHFLGAGFVNPVDDMGPHPRASHPDALDALTRSFAASGYDVKRLVREICATRAYRLGDGPAGNAASSPLFARVPSKSMTPEQVYDSVLFATRGGFPSDADLADRDRFAQRFLASPEGKQSAALLAGSHPAESAAACLRAVTPRSWFAPAALANRTTFAQTVRRPGKSSSPLADSDLVRTGLAAEPGTTLHAIVAGSDGDAAKVRRLFLATLSRPPSAEELGEMRRLIRQSVAAAPPARRQAALADALQDALWALLNSTEFATVP